MLRPLFSHAAIRRAVQLTRPGGKGTGPALGPVMTTVYPVLGYYHAERIARLLRWLLRHEYMQRNA